MPRKWGSVARRGGRVVTGEDWREPPEGEERPAASRRADTPSARLSPPRAPAAKRVPRSAPPETRRGQSHPGTDVHPAKEQGRREERARATPTRESESGRDQRRRGSRGERLPVEVAREVQRAGGRRGELLADRLAHAAEAYARDRYPEARSILRALARDVPAVAAVRELYGLVLYRMGSWSAALKELLEAHRLGDSFDQHPVIADCYRALRRYKKVEQIWEELRRAGASAEVMAEGRLVRAGALADEGKLDAAIALLESAAGRDLRKPRVDHVRQWYALGDLYERSGDLPKARLYFGRVASHDPEHVDVEHRLRGLR